MYPGIHSRLQPCDRRGTLASPCSTLGARFIVRRARAAGARLLEAKLRVVLHVSRVVCVCVSLHFPCMHVREGSSSGCNGFLHIRNGHTKCNRYGALNSTEFS